MDNVNKIENMFVRDFKSTMLPLTYPSLASQFFSVSGIFPASGLLHLLWENAFADTAFLFVGSRNRDGGIGDRHDLIICLIVTISPFVRSCDAAEEMSSRFSQLQGEGAIIAAPWSRSSPLRDRDFASRDFGLCKLNLWVPRCNLRPLLLFNDWHSVRSEVRKIDRR